MPALRPVPQPGSRVRLRIGVLGGSFNPAHAGHRHISEVALQVLGLDQVWWLVSPQNPLKRKADLAPFEARLKKARMVATHPNIVVTDLEVRLKTRYSVETLRSLRKSYPNVTFFWLMGADNLAGFHHWKNWPAMFRENPIVIFHRPTYSVRALSSKAAHRFQDFKKPVRALRTIRQGEGPAWGFVPLRGHHISATRLRAIDPNWAQKI